MPTYEYECAQCQERFEVFQTFHDDPLTQCTACGGKLAKVFHPAGVIFKGSGWYVTDSRSAAERRRFKDDGKAPDKAKDAKPVASDGKASSDAGSSGDSADKASAAGSKTSTASSSTGAD